MICRLSYRRYVLPFKRPVRTAHGVWTVREGVLVRLDDTAGRTGWGEAAPVPGFGRETVDDVEVAVRALGETVSDDEWADEMPGGGGCLAFALAGARAGLRRPRVAESEEVTATSREFLPVAALLPAGQAALAEVEPKAEAGFRVFKWKVGVGDAADEMGLLDDLLARLPTGSRVRLDANGAWDRRQAERWLARCAERPMVEFVEQPCFAGVAEGASRMRAMDDVLRGLAEDYPTKLALDESLVTAGDLARWRDAGWAGVWVVKLGLMGDPAVTLRELAAARADVVFSSTLETAVGAQAALRAAFEWKGEPPRALGFGVWPLFEDGRCNGPAAAPFIRAGDVAALNPEAVWNALS